MDTILTQIEAARKQLVTMQSSIEAINEDQLGKVSEQTKALKEDFQSVKLALAKKLGRVLDALMPLALCLGIRELRPPRVPNGVMFVDSDTINKQRYYLVGVPFGSARCDTGLGVTQYFSVDEMITFCRVLIQEITAAIPRRVEETKEHAKNRGDEVESLRQEILQLAELIKSQLRK